MYFCTFRVIQNGEAHTTASTAPDWQHIHQRAAQLNALMADSRYEKQKSKLGTLFEGFLNHCTPPTSLPHCTPDNVRDFLLWRESSGHTPIHETQCPFRGNPGPQPCHCPRTTAAGTVDSTIGQLRGLLRDQGRGTEWYATFNNGNPAAAPLVKQHLKAVRKERAAALAHPKQAVPLMFDKLPRLHRYLTYRLWDKTLTPAARYLLLRDRAYLKLICFTGDRAGDLGLLQTAQLTLTDTSVSLKSLVGKSFSEAAPRPLLFDRSQCRELCLVTELAEYIPAAAECGVQLGHGHLFRTSARAGSTIVDRPVTSSAMTTRLKKHLQAMGCWQGETSHSARVGCSVTLILLGVNQADVKAHVGWRSDEMVERYTRRASAYREDSAANTLMAGATHPDTVATLGRFRNRMAGAEGSRPPGATAPVMQRTPPTQHHTMHQAGAGPTNISQ